MLYPSIKATYKNKYAYIYIYISDEIKIGGNIYRLFFIGRAEDICIYDTIILPSAKYKQDKNMLIPFIIFIYGGNYMRKV